MQFLNNMTIAKKLTLVFSVIIAVAILMSAVSFYEINAIKSSDQESRDAQHLGETYISYEASFAEQRQGLLYYLLTGDRTGLKQYNDLKPRTAALFEDLKALSANNAEISALVAELDTYFVQWTNQYATQQIDLMRNYLTVNQARAIEVTGEPRAVLAQFNAVAAQLKQRVAEITEQTTQKKDAAFTEFTVSIIISIVILILIAVIAGLTLTRIIAGPIGRMTHTMGDLAEGNLEVEIGGIERKDEIGGMAAAVEVFKKNAIEQREMQAKEAEKQETERLRHEKMNYLTQDFDGKMQSGLAVVTDSVTNVAASAGTMASNASETGTLSQSASTAIEETSGNIQTVASATTELTASITEISHQMTLTSEVSQAAVTQIETTNTRVIALNEAAESIGQVIQIISDIAEQTNLLALNATIESARAGEAGKGFAVVASEVKNLATQTGKATEEISQKIDEIQNETGAAAEAVLDIGKTIRKIDELTAAVAAAVEEQGAATSEIARNVEEAALGASEVARVVQSVATAADETGNLANSQTSVVDELGVNNDGLKTEIRTFLDSVKAL